MPNVQYVTDEEWLEHCRRSLIDDGLLEFGDTGYRCTEKGAKLVDKELRRYELRPGTMILIETRILNGCNCSVW